MADHYKWKQGKVNEEYARRYQTYLARLHHLTMLKGSALEGAQLISLTRRHGFAHAVRRGVLRVKTPFVVIAQHDRTVIRPVRCPAPRRPSAIAQRFEAIAAPCSTSSRHSLHVPGACSHVQWRRYPTSLRLLVSTQLHQRAYRLHLHTERHRVLREGDDGLGSVTRHENTPD
jgi:hypothetical protein